MANDVKRMEKSALGAAAGLKLDTLHDSLFCESNPIPVKWCLHKMGLIKKGIRLPLTWMDEKFDRPLTEGLIKSGVIDE